MVRSLRIRCHQKKVHVLEQGIQPWRPETFQMTDLLGREVPAQGTAFAAFGFEHQRVKLHPMSSGLAGKSPLPGRYVFSHDNVSQILRIHYANQERLEHLYPALYKATGKHRRNPSTAMRRRGALR
jgi:hypothetical protein